MIEVACRNAKPVRIGVNWGSLDQDLLTRLMDENSQRAQPLDANEVMREALVVSALDSAQRAEELGLGRDRIVISCKVSGVQDLIAVYRNLAARCDYALHLGLTEAGMGSKGIVASTAGMAVLLQEGIGDTIRVSLTPEPNGDRTQEVIVAQEILQTLGLRSFMPMVIACPGCGRTTSTYFQELAQKIQTHIRHQMPRVAQAVRRRGRDDRRGDGLRRERPRREQARQHRHQPARHRRAAGRAGLHRRREGPDAQGRAHRRRVPVAGRGLRRQDLRAEGVGMSDLTSKKCEPCEGGVQPLSRAEAQALMKQLKPEWQLADDAKSIRARMEVPQLLSHDELRQRGRAHRERRGPSSGPRVGYGYCRIRYNTHAIGGLSENDFICAAKIDALPRT